MRNLFIVGAVLALATPVFAKDEVPIIPQGAGFSIGGGVIDFSGEDMRDMTGTGGTWDARGIYGTRSLLAVEGAYLGSAQEIDALGLDTDAMLVGTGLEAAGRVNILTGDLKPYLFGGVAWRRYDLTRADTNTSDVNEQDDVVEVPFGVGVSYQLGKVMFDVRGCYRAAFDEELAPAATAGEDADLDSFSATARVGFAF
jgi:hypothetical protein